MIDDPRYTPVAATLPATLPAITREEASRAAQRLVRKFGRKALGGPHQLRDLKAVRVRRCWVSTKPTSAHYKGWGRLVHDVSHIVFRTRHPDFRPHHNLHARLETEIAAYVAASGWLDGALRPAAKPKATTAEKRAKRLAQTEAGIERWESKRRRAENALRKLKRRRTTLLRQVTP